MLLNMVRVAAVTGLKKSGKTTVLEHLVKELTEKGKRVATVKFTHHMEQEFSFDIEGKDTFRHRKAGAFFVVATSGVETVLIIRHSELERKRIDNLLSFLPEKVDYLLCEGLPEQEKSKGIPEIVCLKSTESWQETKKVRGDLNILAFSGIFANEIKEFKGFKVFNVFEKEEVEALAELVERRSKKV